MRRAVALQLAACALAAVVPLVTLAARAGHGPTAIAPPAGSTFVPVQSAEEMREAVLHHLGTATIVIKAAAVAD